jgi:hypothetical protein
VNTHLEKFAANTTPLYDQAVAALAAAASVDEVKEIHDRAEAARIYAHRAKNRSMEMDAAEIRVRSERKLGEMLIELREKKITVRNGKVNRELGQILVTELNVPNSLVKQARAIGAIQPKAFENGIKNWRVKYQDAVDIPLPMASLTDKDGKFKRRARYSRLKSKIVDSGDEFDTPRTIDHLKIGDLFFANVHRYKLECAQQLLLMRLLERRHGGAESNSSVRDVIIRRKLAGLEKQAMELVPELLLQLDTILDRISSLVGS